VLEENRFLATRDGMQAEFIDPEHDARRPARDILGELLAACAPHAAALGCKAELAGVAALAAEPGDHRQRLLAGVPQGETVGAALTNLVRALAAEFSRDPQPAGPRARADSARTP
jgi:carboxylate-amine ligase